MTSLLRLHRERFLETIRSVNPPNQWKVIVVDTYCERLLLAVLSQYEILDENVTTIHNIEQQREQNPTFEALYILQPNHHNIETIIQDFIGPQTKKYAAAHIFFISSLDNKSFAHISQSPIRPVIRSLVELNLDFNPIENMVFTTRTADTFQILYNPSYRSLLDSELAAVSKKLVSLCASLGEKPIIRFYRPLDNPHPARSHAARLAQLLQVDIDEYAKGNADFPPRSNTRPPAVFLLCERGFDVVTPLLHEFTYQAMANDLLSIEEGKNYKYQFQGRTGMEEKTAILEEKDTVWTAMRHMHMKDTIDKLMQDFNKFCHEHANFTDKEKATSLNDMRDMLANLPQFQEMRDQFSLHLNMAEKCMEIFEQKKLLEVGLVEQNCATGVTPEGKFPKSVLEDMIPLLAHPALGMRMLMLYVLFREGIVEEDLQLLLKHAELNSRAHELPLRNLDLLGPYRVTRTFAEHKSSGKTRRRPKAPTTDEDSYELSRFVPPIKVVLEDLINGTLDSQTWAYTMDQPPDTAQTGQHGSLRSQRPTWARGKSTVIEQRQRIIVFILGGATYSESRACYEVSSKWNRDVILGTSEMLTPSTFIRNLSMAKEPRRNLNLSADNTGTIPRQPPHQRNPSPSPQHGLPSRPSPGRIGPSHGSPPNALRPGQGQNGIVGPRPLTGGSQGHGSYGSGHSGSYESRPPHTLSKDSKDGEKKDKKKKKFGMF